MFSIRDIALLRTVLICLKDFVGGGGARLTSAPLYFVLLLCVFRSPLFRYSEYLFR